MTDVTSEWSKVENAPSFSQVMECLLFAGASIARWPGAARGGAFPRRRRLETPTSLQTLRPYAQRVLGVCEAAALVPVTACTVPYRYCRMRPLAVEREITCCKCAN